MNASNKHKFWMVLAAFIYCPFCVPAQNLVINGSFDSNAAGWTANVVKDYQPSFGNPKGCVSLSIPPPTADIPTISQVIGGLTPGVSYAVTGDYEQWTDWGGGSPTNLSFGVAIDGVFLFEVPKPDLAWHSFGFTFVATSSSVTLSLSAQMNGTGVAYAIDNIVMQPIPSVAFQNTQTNMVLLWPTNAIGFSVQCATNLTATDWSDVTNATTTVGTNYSVTLNATQEIQFFRLTR